MSGEIKELSGILSPYELPLEPELVLNTTMLSVEQSVQKIVEMLMAKGIIPSLNLN